MLRSMAGAFVLVVAMLVGSAEAQTVGRYDGVFPVGAAAAGSPSDLYAPLLQCCGGCT